MASTRKFSLRTSNGLNPLPIDVDYAYHGRTKPTPAQRRNAKRRLANAVAAMDQSMLAVAKGGGEPARAQLQRDMRRVERSLRRKFDLD